MLAGELQKGADKAGRESGRWGHNKEVVVTIPSVHQQASNVIGVQERSTQVDP